MNKNDRAITALVTIAHGLVHTYELSIPIFVALWLTEFSVINLGFATVEVTTASLGVVVTVGYGLFGLGALPGGVLVDRLGSRRLIAGCLLGMGTSFLLLSIAPSVLVIAFALIVWGVAASVYHPAGLSLISKGITKRGTGFAYHGIAGNLGIGLGPLLAAVLLLFLDWNAVAAILSVPALAAAGYASRASFDPEAAVAEAAPDGGSRASDGGSRASDGGNEAGETSNGSDRKSDAGVDSVAEFLAESRRLFAGSFVFVFAIVMCSGLYYRGILTFMPELLSGLQGFDPIPLSRLLPGRLNTLVSATGASKQMVNPQDYFYSGLLLVGAIGQYAGGKLTDQFPVEYGIAAGFSGLAVLAVVFLPAAAVGLGPLLAVGALMGVNLFVVQPLYQATVAEYTPAGTRGLSYGYTYLGVFGVGSLGGGLAGAIIEFAGTAYLFAVLAGFAVIAAGLGLFLARASH